MNETKPIFENDALSFTRFRRLFYIVTPKETTFEKLESVPNYIDEALPWALVLIFLEFLYSAYKKKKLFRTNDTITSINSGILQQTVKVLSCGCEFTIACWLYENYGFKFLNWDSLLTWIIAFVLVDFTYYWFHRGAHEINFFWAFHQMHHSSEDYNLSTAFRQGMFQGFLASFYSLPEALILPPSVHMAHLGLNKINQFWVHTQVIRNLGPLEHILVTPSHHRVHHGRNPYCIDKNYSGTFIIWDKLFGTFQVEKQEEPVIFGLVHNVNTFDALYLQMFHYTYIFFEKVPSMKTFGDKLKAIFYGPGWFPGTPRMGNLSDIPEVEKNVQKFDPHCPKWIQIYCVLHMIMINLIFAIFLRQRDNMTFVDAFLYALLIMFSIQIIGWFFENKPYAAYCELLRCALLYYWIFERIWPLNTISNIYFNAFFGISTAIWFVKVMSIHSSDKMKTM